MNFIPLLSSLPLLFFLLLPPPDEVLLDLKLQLFSLPDLLIFHLLSLSNLLHILDDFQLCLQLLLLFLFLDGFVLGLLAADLL